MGRCRITEVCGYAAKPFEAGTDSAYNEQVDKGGKNPEGIHLQYLV